MSLAVCNYSSPYITSLRACITAWISGFRRHGVGSGAGRRRASGCLGLRISGLGLRDKNTGLDFMPS